MIIKLILLAVVIDINLVQGARIKVHKNVRHIKKERRMCER